MPIEFVVRNAEDTYLCFSAKSSHVENLDELNAFAFNYVIFAFTKYTHSSNYFMEILLKADIPDAITPQWIYHTLLNPFLESRAAHDYIDISPFFIIDHNTSYQITQSAQLVIARQIISYGFHESLIFNAYEGFSENEPIQATLTTMFSALSKHSASYLGQPIIYSLKNKSFMTLKDFS